MVVKIDANTVFNIQRLVLGKYRCTRITFLIGIIPVTIVAIKREIELTFLHLRFLKAEEIGVEFLENIFEALCYAGAKSVYVPRNKFHTVLIVKLLPL